MNAADVLQLIGLALMGAGLYLYYPQALPGFLLGLGAIMFGLGVAGIFRKRGN